MSGFSVDPASVRELSDVVRSAGSDVAHSRDLLDRGARAPESPAVSGGHEAARNYSDSLGEATAVLRQLEAALDGMAVRLSLAGRLYAETETTNTVRGNHRI